MTNFFAISIFVGHQGKLFLGLTEPFSSDQVISGRAVAVGRNKMFSVQLFAILAMFFHYFQIQAEKCLKSVWTNISIFFYGMASLSLTTLALATVFRYSTESVNRLTMTLVTYLHFYKKKIYILLLKVYHNLAKIKTQILANQQLLKEP